MCYPKPGPRCSGHMSTKLAKAKVDYESNPTETNREAVQAAQLAFDKTPEGIDALRRNAVATISNDDAAETFRLAARYESERTTRIAAHEAVNGSVVKFVRVAQDEAEVPVAFRNTTFGYRSDDPLGNALNGSTEVGGYSSDSVYELSDTEDHIIITTTWSPEDENAQAGTNFYDVNDLDENHRPTQEEAQVIADGLNAGFNENVNDVPEDLSDWESERRGEVARSLADVYDFEFDGGEEVREAVVARIGDRIEFKHDVAETSFFDADYVLNAWDDLYGR